MNLLKKENNKFLMQNNLLKREDFSLTVVKPSEKAIIS